MNIEWIKDRLSHFKGLFINNSTEITTLDMMQEMIIQQENNLIEAYKDIISTQWGYDYSGIDPSCLRCGNSKWQDHKDSCIVKKAIKYTINL